MSTKDWEKIKFTNPENHNPEQFIYLVHGITTDHIRNLKKEIAVLKSGKYDKNKKIDLRQHPEDISKKPINIYY